MRRNGLGGVLHAWRRNRAGGLGRGAIALTSLASGVGTAAIGAAVLFVGPMLAPPAAARPPAPVAFCKAYPGSQACHTGFADCTTCHTVAPARNAFGTMLSERILPGAPRPLTDEAFLAALPSALKAIEDLDADGDGVTNIAELRAGSQMANAGSVPKAVACTQEQAERSKSAAWNVCGYDPEYAFRKVHLDFCGRSPARADVEAFRGLRGKPAAWRESLVSTLDRCLKSPYWIGKEGVVWNLANPKIRPAHTVKSGDNPGPVPLGDYDDDYNLFAYANSGDRDVRDLLLGQYFVERTKADPLAFRVLSEDELAKRGRGTRQPVVQDKRAGMITTRWFSAVHTMFTAIPRTTAAQAYRAYLGYDIAKMQGLTPVSHEPADYDAKGVAAPQCAACHSTLDPLTYPFTRYNGISGGYAYDANRLKEYVRVDGPRVAEAPASGMIFGQPVADLRAWAAVAANSDAFAQNVVRDYWKLLIGREPDLRDQVEYTRAWKGLKSADVYNYRVEKMLHGLVLTNAYGQP